MKLWRSLLAELIERVSTRAIARLLAEPSGPLSDVQPPLPDPPLPTDSVDLLSHEEVQQMLVERDAMRARHPATEPAPPPEDDEPPVGSVAWRGRQSGIRGLK